MTPEFHQLQLLSHTLRLQIVFGHQSPTCDCRLCVGDRQLVIPLLAHPIRSQELQVMRVVQTSFTEPPLKRCFNRSRLIGIAAIETIGMVVFACSVVARRCFVRKLSASDPEYDPDSTKIVFQFGFARPSTANTERMPCWIGKVVAIYISAEPIRRLSSGNVPVAH